jgi:UDP-N-acetylmuramoyl-L-alanyl-D-glutamate--2,6-diaminopimelate ligase
MSAKVHSDSAVHPEAARPDPAGLGLALEVLTSHLGGVLRGDGQIRVVDVEQDSRRVGHGALFAALRGARTDGLAHVSDAVRRGAVAVLCEPGHHDALAPLGVPILEVNDTRRAMARAASLVHGEPTRALRVVGITGTNGKTTTAHLVEAALEATGALTGIVGTLGHRLRGMPLGEGHTSPEADELQRIAASMRQSGASHLVMEVSSIALAADRVAEVVFDVAAFTNLTQDHLDFHGTMEAYAAAKDRLFLEWRPRVSVVNVDDPHGDALASRLRASGGEVLTVSVRADSGADLAPTEVVSSTAGTRLVLADGLTLESPLVGAHNASNLMVALGIARALGLGPSAFEGLARMRNVAGRLERCDDPNQDDVVAVVDYAHTPDALERVLASVRGLTDGELWCVFGCGGDRDPRKRAPMGEAVARAADVAIVTNDNPRSEAPEAIAGQILVGVARAGAASRHLVELDRARAIELAIAGARPGDVVLIAGKGHEPYQIIGARTLDFDDREEVRAALARRRARQGGH